MGVKTGPLYWTFACVVLAFGLVVHRSAADNREQQNGDVWFVHATDPHIFLTPPEVKERRDPQATQRELEKQTRTREKQEKLNQEALSDMLKRIRSLPGGEGPSAFLVMTGDLGIDPCDIATKENAQGRQTPGTAPPAESGSDDQENKTDSRSAKDCLDRVDPDKRKKQIEETAKALSESPVPNIYLIAGNNDIARESAGDDALRYFNKFIDEVQAKLTESKSSIHLHNLTRCYASGENSATCYADIPNSDYRLIGFPSYSFKNSKDETGEDHAEAQAKQFEMCRQLLEDAQQAGKKVLIISHTPEMDDPFALAQARYVNPTSTATPTPTSAEAVTTAKKGQQTEAGSETKTKNQAETKTDKSPSVSTWKVSKEVRDGWKDLLATDSVVAVLAGHLHDSHKEIYQRPYKWSSGSQMAFQKLFLAPPLAVKNQDKSPIQARGFSLIHLKPDRVVSRLFWYDSETHAFTPNAKSKHQWEQRGFWRCFCQCPRTIIMWLWKLDKADNPLTRMAVLLIAFLTAFLTIIAIWQIPPAIDPFMDDKKTGQAESKTAQSASNTSMDSSPYSNKFGKTVIAGLSGLAVTEVAKAVGNQQASADTRWYYVVWFILFFFLLLLGLNAWRALVEALRASVNVAYYPIPRVGRVTTSKWDRFKDWFSYLQLRAGHWLSSLRVPTLTGFDTFINLIQGRNQTRTQVFEKTIIDQQWNVIRVADRIRSNLNHFIEGRVRQGRQKDANTAQASAVTQPASVRSADLPGLVRVNISVLSNDQTSVYYISRAAGSSHSPFPKRSLAWLSVFTGEIRWYESAYRRLPDFDKIVLFDNSLHLVPGDDAMFLLKDHYQVRAGEDYHAFVVMPVPSPRRGFGSDYVKGAIHVSFRDESDLGYIWQDPAIAPNPGLPANYNTPKRVLEDWCRDDGICASLNISIAVLGELLRGFNEVIYKSYIEANQPD